MRTCVYCLDAINHWAAGVQSLRLPSLAERLSSKKILWRHSASRGQGLKKDKDNHHQQHRQGDEDRGFVFGAVPLASVMSTTQTFMGFSERPLSSMFPVRAMVGL